MQYVDISSVSLQNGIERIEEYDFDAAPSRARRRVRDGDTILSTVRTYLKAVARVVQPSINLIVSTGFAVVRPGEGLDSGYLSYFLRSEGLVGQVVSHSVGVSYPAVNASQVMNLPALIPPFDEQQAIADFLDRETARIDALIATKRRFLAVLHQKRVTMISNAVTRGVDANTQSKPSGIEWLKEIPAHWQTKRLRYLFRMVGGMTPDKSESRYWDGDIPWVTPKDMKIDAIADSEDHITRDALVETGLSIISCGAVLVVVRGMILSHSIPVALTIAPVTVNQDMKALLATGEVHPHYLAWMLRGLKGFLLTLVEESGHGTKALRTDALRSAKVPLPPLEEQERIAAELAARTAHIDDMGAITRRAIKSLQEERSSLISAAVTGQFDTRTTA